MNPKMHTCFAKGCTNKTTNAYCKEHTVFPAKRKRGNKYNAVKTLYNERWYDSKLEARYAHRLDLLIKAGEVEKWEPQKQLRCEVNGVFVCSYKLDFWVKYKNGKTEWWEVKSKATKTSAWKIKWNLVHALFPELNFVLKE